MTKKNKPSSFGDIRSLLYERPVTISTWNKLARALYFFEEPELLQEEVFPYCVEAIADWPDDLRRPGPSHWVFLDDGGERDVFHPALALATHVELDGLLGEEGARTLAQMWRGNLLRGLFIRNLETSPEAFAILLDAEIWGSILELSCSMWMPKPLLERLLDQPWMSRLIRLGLDDTDLDDDVLAYMAKKDNFTNLEHLELANNNITPEGIEHLQGMKSLGEVKFLSLVGNAFQYEDAELFDEQTRSLPGHVLDDAWDEYYWDAFE